MIRRTVWVVLLGVAGCGGARAAPRPTPTPVSRVQETATSADINALWARAQHAVRHGKWGEAVKQLERVLLEFAPGDTRVSQAHFFLGEAQFALGSHLEGAREFRKVSDDTPNDPLAPVALLRAGDVYADLWRRPELDPSYGQTALATYQELLNRYPGSDAAKRAQQQIDDLQERFAYKEYKAALYYIRLKAYDSAILYLKDLVATYPRSAVAPDALIHLVQAYRTLGYKEDVQETCGYIRRFHPRASGLGKACPARSLAPLGMTAAIPVRSIGLLGGSFDPVHHGHLIAGQVAAEALGLDELRFVPAREQPFKGGRHVAAAADRAAMLDLAIAGMPGFAVERLELDRPGPSYTVDTLRALRARDPGAKLTLLLGADAAAELGAWHRAEELPGLARIVVFGRPGAPIPASPLIAATVEVPAIEISATEIRGRVRTGRQIRYWVPDAVAEYIARHRLYLDPE